MAVPTSAADLSTTAASNSPAGSEAIGTSLDDYLRAIQSILKQENSKGADTASATAVTIPSAGSYFVITGTTTITSFADSWTGRTVFLKFSGALTLTHSAGLILPGGVNITTAAGDVLAFNNESAGVWRCCFYEPASGSCLVGSPTGGNGFRTGAGGTVTQATDKSTSVTLNKPSGKITMHAAALGAGSFATFAVLNSVATAIDTVTANHAGTGGTATAYSVEVLTVLDGVFYIRITNVTGGSLSEAVTIQFNVHKGATA